MVEEKIQWGGEEVNYQQWLGEPVYKDEDCPKIIGAEVEALTLIYLRREVADEVMKRLSDKEKLVVSCWNRLRLIGGQEEQEEQKNISSDLFRQCVGIRYRRLRTRKSLELVDGFLGQVVYGRTSSLIHE